LNRQIAALEEKFLQEGGVKEKMTALRLLTRQKNSTD
jgi:four helix bundle suffix protein